MKAVRRSGPTRSIASRSAVEVPVLDPVHAGRERPLRLLDPRLVAQMGRKAARPVVALAEREHLGALRLAVRLADEAREEDRPLGRLRAGGEQAHVLQVVGEQRDEPLGVLERDLGRLVVAHDLATRQPRQLVRHRPGDPLVAVPERDVPQARAGIEVALPGAVER
jgi:hypothetical protein